MRGGQRPVRPQRQQAVCRGRWNQRRTLGPSGANHYRGFKKTDERQVSYTLSLRGCHFRAKNVMKILKMGARASKMDPRASQVTKNNDFQRLKSRQILKYLKFN